MSDHFVVMQQCRHEHPSDAVFSWAVSIRRNMQKQATHPCSKLCEAHPIRGGLRRLWRFDRPLLPPAHRSKRIRHPNFGF